MSVTPFPPMTPTKSFVQHWPFRWITWPRVVLGILWLLSLVAAARLGLFIVEKRVPILRRIGLLEMSGIKQTNLYAVAFQRVPVAEDGRYGAIAPLLNGVLFSSRSGRLWYFDSTRTGHALKLRVPVHAEEFDADPANATTIEKDHFAVKGLLVQPTATGVRILSSHNHWDSAKGCYGLRVSVVEMRVDALLAGGTGTWRTLFDTRPCLDLAPPGSGRRMPTIGAGGRMVPLSDREILLTVGVFISDALTTSDPEGIRSADTDYGKTIAIDLRTGRTRVFSRGHRNPQGLAVGEDGRIWMTEHAARGGDELNLLRQGGDYGFPYVSYGTAYGTLDWPLGTETGRHEGYDKATFAWVPSIGPSQLVVVRGTAFARWRGDLIVSSLAARSLFRLRLEGDRVVYAEPIQTIHRMRDLIETAKGEIVLLAEDGFLDYFQPVDAAMDNANLDPLARGQLVAGRCQGCHTFERNGANGNGPNLYGILGRRVAAVPDFNYSQAMRGVGGRWSEESLRRFLADPDAAVPGTSMELPAPLTPEEIDHLLVYLRSVR